MSVSSHHQFDNAADAVSVAAKEQKIGFDDIDTTPYGFAVIQNGYAKLDWSNFYCLNSQASGVGTYGNSGYFTGITSGDQVAYNPYFATDASVYLTSGTFTFDSVQMTSAWDRKETVEVQAFDANGNMIHDVTVKISDAGPLDFHPHWAGVSEVTFLFNDNGKQDPNVTGSGNNVVFDDFKGHADTTSSALNVLHYGVQAAAAGGGHGAGLSATSSADASHLLAQHIDLHQPVHAIA